VMGRKKGLTTRGRDQRVRVKQDNQKKEERVRRPFQPSDGTEQGLQIKAAVVDISERTEDKRKMRKAVGMNEVRTPGRRSEPQKSARSSGERGRTWEARKKF